MPFRKASWQFAALAALAISLVYTGSPQAQTVQNPRRIAEGPVGQLLVTDRQFGAVVAVDMDSLEPIWSFPLPQEGNPFGLATWNRLVFVGNTETRNVEVYQIQGAQADKIKVTFKYNLGDTPEGEVGPIGNPISIAVDRKHQLVFVLDGFAKKINVFDRKGAFAYAFEPRGGDDTLLSPVALAVDETRREVLVADYGDPSGGFSARKPARILIYDYDGNWLAQIDGSDSFGGSFLFARVQGMATSADGRIFAADPLGGRILVLDRNSGALLEVLGTQGQEPGQLMLPLDVFFDERTGDLYVSNNQGARRVEVLRGAGRSR
ncbi:MAG: hypothetical protein OEU56_03690 [Rhodospirillales bacterium]|nr:hypothetical protein [Rhodospirillales bacterium]